MEGDGPPNIRPHDACLEDLFIFCHLIEVVAINSLIWVKQLQQNQISQSLWKNKTPFDLLPNHVT